MSKLKIDAERDLKTARDEQVRLGNLVEHYKDKVALLDKVSNEQGIEALAELAVKVSWRFQTSTNSAFARFANLFLIYRAECDRMKPELEALRAAAEDMAMLRRAAIDMVSDTRVSRKGGLKHWQEKAELAEKRLNQAIEATAPKQGVDSA